ncbi:MAG: YceH family protein [Solirubrobacteraceae bacterium]
MHFGQLTDVEQRVLGCLIEKRWTTPDQYPLSLNALRLACNQSTNRDPVTHYDEGQVRDAAQRLSRYGLARLASGAGSRATKYRHLAEEGLGLDRQQLAVLCVLLLRGPQTPGELKGRSDRMAHIESLDHVERILGELADKGYAERMGRRPGQKEDRFRHLFGGDGSDEEPIAAGGFDEPVAGQRYAEPPRTYEEPSRSYDEPAAVARVAASSDDGGALEARVAALEAEVADLRAQLADLLD